MTKLLLCIGVVILPLISIGQIGGRSSYQFLALPTNARVAGLGGENISFRGNDVNSIVFNPASLNKDMHNQVSLNVFNYFAGIKASNLVYANTSPVLGTYGLGLQVIDFGQFSYFDEAGNYQGNFSCREFAATYSQGQQIGNFSLGATIKFAGSYFENYSSYAFLGDLGGQFKHPKKDFTIGLLFKNFGVPLKNYNSLSSTRLPADIQLGASIKPEHMPLRLSLTIHKLYKYDIAYYDPNSKVNVDATGASTNKKPSVLDQLTRHIVIGAEGILSKNVNLRVGYNFLRRADLKSEAGSSGWSGLSLGGMINIKRIRIEYTQVFYHAAGSSGILTLASNLGEWQTKNSTAPF